MEKTTNIIGLVYTTPKGGVVDYGLDKLYKASKSSQIEIITETDMSVCPPLYDSYEFERNVDYKATIQKLTKQGIRVLVNGELGFIYLNNLSKYWGCDNCLKNNYKPGLKIDVCFLEMKGPNRIFTEKGSDTIPMNLFTYMLDDIVDMHIGPADENNLLVWFNGIPIRINPKNDDIFRKRVQCKIYYPGYPVKAKVVSVDESIPGKKYYRFSILHEHIDYGIKTGEQICRITEEAGVKYVNINSEKGKCLTRIPEEEVPADFPLTNNYKFHAMIEVTGFDEYGEPVIRFGSLMKELYKRHDGKSFDVELLKFNDTKSMYRIWMGPNGLSGVATKSLIDSYGDLSCKFEGHIIDGEVHLSRKGCSYVYIKEGNIETAYINARELAYVKATISGKPALIFNCTDVHNPYSTMQVKVIYANHSEGLIICLPTYPVHRKDSSLEIGSKVSMQILKSTDNRIVLGNGSSIGIMDIKNWDWSDGKTLQVSDINSLYFETLISDITPEGLLILDRHELLDNPWKKLEQMKDQPIEVTIKEIKKLLVYVEVEGVIIDMNWNNLCPFHISYAKYLYNPGDTVTLMLENVDIEKKRLHLRYMPKNAVNPEITFDEETEYIAEVVKVIPIGILISVNGLYGVIRRTKLLIDREYIPGESLNVRLIRHTLYGPAHNIEFSHIATVDTSNIIKYGNIILSAKVEDIDEHQITFAHNGVRLYCYKHLAKYFSAERNPDFAQTINKGQLFNLRVTDIQTSGVVPDSMPDYSSLALGNTFKARIDKILKNAYVVMVDDLKDSFHIPFAGFCDWGTVHFETRKEGDIVDVTLISYTYSSNTPVFSMIAGQEHPWKGLKKKDTIKVRGLGSLLKKKDFYVNVNGVPVKLCAATICSLLGKPWLGSAVDYKSICELEGSQEFELDIRSIDMENFKMDLQHHIKEIPKIVRNASIIYNREESNCVWVKCENGVIGRILRSEIPEEYESFNVIEQAVCTSFNHSRGYANLSVKALFAKEEESPNKNAHNSLHGIIVTEGMVPLKGQLVRGVLKSIDKQNKRCFIKVGPYLGIITFAEMSHIFCYVPEKVFEKSKEYDFRINNIDASKNNLLYLSRKEFAPIPPKNIIINMPVSVIVRRYCNLTEMIVVEVKELSGLEAIIYASDLEGCKVRNKIRYPNAGFKFTAKVKDVHKSKSGLINKIILHQGKI